MTYSETTYKPERGQGVLVVVFYKQP